MRRALALAAALSLCATVAYGHITVAPALSKRASQETYTLNVPTEGASPTTAVELDVPAGVEIVSVEAPASEHKVVKVDGRTVSITWKVDIPPRQSRKLVFTALNPKKGERIQWNAHQIFADGSRADWVEGPGTRRPAPSTRLSD